MTDLVLTRRAQEDLNSLPSSFREAVQATIDSLVLDPRVGKPLVGVMRGLWVLRVGNYRVCYTIEQEPGRSRVVVQWIRHRAVAYRRRRGRG